MEETIFRFSIETNDGGKVRLDKYKGKVLLIVNTATECGFTPQFKELEELYQRYKDKGFEILGIPSNDFGRQEPRNNKEIVRFCKAKYGVSFPLFAKIKVRGMYAHPLYKFLSDKKKNGRTNTKPRWNFHKYLIDPAGKVVDFFYPFTKPTSKRIRKKINKLLGSGRKQPRNPESPGKVVTLPDKAS